MKALVHLVVPDLADACAVDVVEPGGSVRRVRHSRTTRAARALARRAPFAPGGSAAFARMLRSGGTEHRADLLVVPLTARAHVLGVLTLLATPRRRSSPSVIAVVEDVAARAALALDAARLAREVQNASSARDQMLATLSHELRSAMNAVLGWAQILRSLDPRGPSPALAARALDTIERNTRLQAQLIEDLFDVSRIVSGKLAVDLAPVDLAQIAADILEDCLPAASAKGVRLTAALTPVRVRGDERRLHQVVANLVANALKFTDPGGSIVVRTRLAGGAVELQVIDSGRGIERKLLPHVFDRFRQGGGSHTTGLGIGLAIVRSIVELHGGRVRAESDGAGKGATVTVTLPRLAA